MKKFTTIILLLLVSVCFVLSGCGSAPLTMPQDYLNPVSNGGFVVGAGNYMYFANAYKASSSISTPAENGENTAQYSLKRLKIDATKKGFAIDKDQESNVKFENVINKIAGFEVSSMYVVNDYLYFATPNVHKNKENNQEFNLTTLFRIKLDGSGLTEILTTKKDGGDFYLTKDKKLLVFDDSKIKSFNLALNSTDGSVLADNVESVVFPREEEQDIEWLYYTASREEGSQFTGNILKRINLKTDKLDAEFSKSISGVTMKIVSQSNEIVFYTKASTYNENHNGVYSYNGVKENKHRTLTEGIEDETDLMYVQAENVDDNCFVFIYKDNLYIQYMSATADGIPTDDAEKLTSQATNIHFSNGNWIYYSTTEGIYRYSVLSNKTEQISDHANIQTDLVDFDGRYVYYFVKIDGQKTETQYLYRADCYSEEVKTECVASLEEGDLITETETEEQ